MTRRSHSILVGLPHCELRIASLLLVVVCGCSRTLTIEVEGTGHVGDMVHHGRHEVGTIQSVGEPNEAGVRAIEVEVHRQFVVPPLACGYTVDGAVLIRGGIEETREDWIPHCTETVESLENVLGGLFDDLRENGRDGVDWSPTVRAVVESNARMADIPLPPEPDVTEPED